MKSKTKYYFIRQGESYGHFVKAPNMQLAMVKFIREEFEKKKSSSREYLSKIRITKISKRKYDKQISDFY